MNKVNELLIKNYAILLRGNRISLSEIPSDTVTVTVDGVEKISSMREEVELLAAKESIDILNS